MKKCRKFVYAILVLVMAIGMTGCSNPEAHNIEEVEESADNLIFYNDIEARKILSADYPASFSESYCQMYADKAYLTYAIRGTDEPEPVVLTTENGYARPLGDGYYLEYRIIEEEGYKLGQCMIVNEEGAVLLTGPEEIIRYDDDGKPYQVSYRYPIELNYDYTYSIDNSGNPRIDLYVDATDSLLVFNYKSLSYYKDLDDDSIYHVEEVIQYDGGYKCIGEYIYDYDEDGKLQSIDYLSDDGYSKKIVYNHIDDDHFESVETSSNGYKFDYKYYKGFLVESSAVWNNTLSTHKFLYDNNGLPAMYIIYEDGVKSAAYYYVYDFEKCIIYNFMYDFITNSYLDILLISRM